MTKTPKANRPAIRLVIEGLGLYLKFRLLGLKALTKGDRKKLLGTGLVQKEDLGKPTITDAYLRTHFELLRQPESKKSIRDYSLKHIESSAAVYIDKFIEKAAADLSTTAAQALLQHRNDVIAETRRGLSENIGKKTNRTIARELREKTQELYKDFDRVVTTELARAQSLGALDAIVSNNSNVSPSDVYVYKVGPRDAKTCKYCLDFWYLGDSPKVYRLSDLLANGSNYGKKSGDWLPTVEPTHPNERHLLLELPKSFGFVGGKIAYVSENHNEYLKQQES